MPMIAAGLESSETDVSKLSSEMHDIKHQLGEVFSELLDLRTAVAELKRHSELPHEARCYLVHCEEPACEQKIACGIVSGISVSDAAHFGSGSGCSNDTAISSGCVKFTPYPAAVSAKQQPQHKRKQQKQNLLDMSFRSPNFGIDALKDSLKDLKALHSELAQTDVWSATADSSTPTKMPANHGSKGQHQTCDLSQEPYPVTARSSRWQKRFLQLEEKLEVLTLADSEVNEAPLQPDAADHLTYQHTVLSEALSKQSSRIQQLEELVGPLTGNFYTF